MLLKIGYSEMIYVESYGENFFKSYNISENKTFRYVNANGIFSMDQINIRGIYDCDGIVEEVDTSASLNMVCKLTDEFKKVSYAKFERKDSGSLVTVFNFLSGEGVIGLLEGEKCLGASHRFNVETLHKWILASSKGSGKRIRSHVQYPKTGNGRGETEERKRRED